jgi:signal transduction histidine kinase
MLAILLLPRQFQMAVVGNTREGHIRTAMWLFPAYLLVINIFVLPIALAGVLTFADAPATAADYFVLTLPMQHRQEGLALLAFIGGMSSATSMVIVESIALSTMVLNSLVVPWLVRPGLRRAAQGAALRDLSGLLLGSKRLAIAAIILLGYAYERLIGESYTLVNIGLISFGAVAQFAPAYLGALYWRHATRAGALVGLIVGFVIWAYTLLLPSFVRSGWLPESLLTSGPFGLAWLRPDQLFGATGLGFWANSVFWSLAGNAGAFAAVSLFTRPGQAESAQAAAFVDVFRRDAGASSPTQPVELSPQRVGEVLAKFVGREAADAAFSRSSDGGELLQVAERALSGALGPPSAQAILDGLMRPEVPRFAAIIDIIGSVSQSLEQSRVDLQRRVRELSLLYEATSRIAGTLDRRHMMDEVLALLRREFQFDTLIVRLQDDEGRLRIESQLGLDPAIDGHAGAGELPSRETYFGDCFLDNRVVAVEDPAQPDKRLWRPTSRVLARHSFIHAPITVESRPIGVLSAYASTERAYFTPEFVQFFQTVAAQLGLGLQNARLFRELGLLSEELEAKVRQRTAELESANERLTELDRLKSDFVSTVSHELRTPLTTIRSLSESLLDGLTDGGGIRLELQEQFLGIIVQESQRLSRMISQLLDLARIEAGKMEWRPEPFDLAEETAQVAQANRALFDSRGIDLVAGSSGDEVPVVADRDRVIQVLTNLLSNAAKFTPSGGGVAVRAFAEDANAVVEVEDTGPGIAPEQLEAIFERFRQVGDTLTAKPEGAGLGLPISRQLVEHQGGTLTARSTLGRGSTFRMTLPLSRLSPEFSADSQLQVR